VAGKAIVGCEPADRPQSFGNRIFAVCGKLMAVSLDIGAHDLPGQCYDLGSIVMRPDYMQVVHMAHEGFVARATGISKFGARAPGKRYKLLRNRLDECHARNRWLAAA
jgi:hypothetical protein